MEVAGEELGVVLDTEDNGVAARWCKVPFRAARGTERNERFGRPLSRCGRPPLFTVPLDLRSPLPPFPSVPSLSSYPLLDSCYDLLTA